MSVRLVHWRFLQWMADGQERCISRMPGTRWGLKYGLIRTTGPAKAILTDAGRRALAYAYESNNRHGRSDPWRRYGTQR